MFTHYKTVGFTGSRTLHPDRASLIRDIATHARNASATVIVGCAGGADEAIRRTIPTARIISVRDYYRIPLYRARFAARSAAIVQALVAQSPRSCLIAFPGDPCPPGLKISRSPFKGHGSGTWATVALAASYAIPAFVFVPFIPDDDRLPRPASYSLPAWWGEWEHIGWKSPFSHVAGAYILRQSLQLQLQLLAPLPRDLDDKIAWSFAAASGIPCF